MSVSNLKSDPSKQRSGSRFKWNSPRLRRWAAFLVCVCILAGFWAAWAGRLLVVDNPKSSDVIVVLAGDRNDVRLLHGLQLLRQGYAKELVLDAPNWVIYGRSQADLASEYLRKIATNDAAHLHVCSFGGHSTELELAQVSDCIHSVAPNARTAIVVTSNFHTRRALSVARRILPEYGWCAGSAPDPDFGAAWWTRRQWAKTAVQEWQKLLWWTLVERWTAHPHGSAKAT